jgi:hypothetical protein
MVVNWVLDARSNPLAGRYRTVIGPAPVLLIIPNGQGDALRDPASGIGRTRRRRLERATAELTVVQPDDEMITTYPTLRAECQQIGQPLRDKPHDGDR